MKAKQHAKELKEQAEKVKAEAADAVAGQ